MDGHLSKNVNSDNEKRTTIAEECYVSAHKLLAPTFTGSMAYSSKLFFFEYCY